MPPTCVNARVKLAAGGMDQEGFPNVSLATTVHTSGEEAGSSPGHAKKEAAASTEPAATVKETLPKIRLLYATTKK